jgi:FkbM family methyltransferase
MMRAGFLNWRRPALLGAVYYRFTRVSPKLATPLGRLTYELQARSGTKLVARAQDFDAPAEVFGNNEYAIAGLNWSAAQFVLDLGAHIGCFTLWLAERSQARVYCVEPNPDAFERLSRNVQGLRASGRATLRQAGLAGSSGRMHLILAANSASVRLGTPDGRQADGGEVDVITLEQALDHSGFPYVDVVKMDIEGAEYSVLEAVSPAVFRNISGWVIECHPTASKDGSTAAQILEAAGYEVVLDTKPGGLALLVATRRSHVAANMAHRLNVG